MAGVDRKWAERIRAGDARALTRQFRHEAGELRRLLMDVARPVTPSWRDFRHFLADVGPSPGPAYELQPLTSAEAWGPDNAAWILRPKAVKPLPPKAPSSPGSSYSQWTMLAGMPVEYGDLPAKLGLSFSDISAVIAVGGSLEGMAAPATDGEEDSVELDWFSDSPSHRQAFRQAYLAWRARVQVRYRRAATPKFLYLYMLAPAMAQAKASLEKEGLWTPHTPAGVARRDASAAWKRFNELLPKAVDIVAGFELYRQYSLTQDIGDLSAQVVAAEARLRQNR